MVSNKTSVNKVIFIIGVSGCGKSTIGRLLSKRLKIPYFDGDDYHPKSNIEKMKQGDPLTDDDRHGWLVTLNNLAVEQLKTNSCIIGCSALKASYRDILSNGIEDQVKWVHLSGSFNLILKRINQRKNHFMPSKLLKSQYDAIELPKRALEVDIHLNPEQIVEKIVHAMNRTPQSNN